MIGDKTIQQIPFWTFYKNFNQKSNYLRIKIIPINGEKKIKNFLPTVNFFVYTISISELKIILQKQVQKNFFVHFLFHIFTLLIKTYFFYITPQIQTT